MKAATRNSAFEIIRNEHRAIAAVVHCFDQILKEVRDQVLEPPYSLFALIMRYLKEFPDRFHHPKEDDFLFPALVERDPMMGEVVCVLQQQHEDCARMTAALDKLLAAWQADPRHGFDAFDQAAQAYVAFQREHIRLEETTVLPAAREKLTAEDWAAIDRAFNENDDPIFGANPQAAFNGLFRKIVATAPAPWGLGARRELERETKRETILAKFSLSRK